MVSHADRSPLSQPIPLFATTRLVLPYYLALKEQQARRAKTTAPVDGQAKAGHSSDDHHNRLQRQR